MADEDHPRSLVDDRPELVVHIPEAQAPEVPATRVEDRSVPWIDRREAPWIIVGVAVVLIGLLVLLEPRTVEVSAAPERIRATTSVDAGSPPWAALWLPVPESLRTHTANVNGSVDVLAVADLGAAQSFVGAVTTADGPTVQQIFGDQAFSIASPTGATAVAFLPYQAGSALIVAPGQEVTFAGTLMPVPDDFATMVGADAALIGARSGVYVRVVPETLRIVTPVPETG